jgi:hypothetical protein
MQALVGKNSLERNFDLGLAKVVEMYGEKISQ